ncbi:uncharacterized protein LOC142018636 [Carettochelys insculpta]|uniref:uncharacterized protein LOC142018636 n=1 Tax=Carettochelys insculpta TaxID=44489 RepID=UPI003EBD5275
MAENLELGNPLIPSLMISTEFDNSWTLWIAIRAYYKYAPTVNGLGSVSGGTFHCPLSLTQTTPQEYILIHREVRDILGPRHTSSPPATLDTSAKELQQALEVESAPAASPTPQGPPQEPTPGAPEEEEEEGESSSSDAGLRIAIPSRSSSRTSAPRVSPERGSGPLAAPLEGPESASEVSVVPDSPRGHHSRPVPRWRTDQPHGGEDGGPSTTSRRRRTPSCWPSTVGSWRSPSSGCEWRNTFSSCRSGRWPGASRHGGPSCAPSTVLRTTWPPHAAPAATAPTLPAPPAAPAAAPSTVALPPATEGPSAEGDLGPADTRQPYLPVRPASQPRAGLRPRWGSRPPTPSTGLKGCGAQDVAPPPFVYIPPSFKLVCCK